jgi:hypothetical protein
MSAKLVSVATPKLYNPMIIEEVPLYVEDYKIKRVPTQKIVEKKIKKSGAAPYDPEIVYTPVTKQAAIEIDTDDFECLGKRASPIENCSGNNPKNKM